MAFVEDRWKYEGNENCLRWRARYRAPTGQEPSKSFLRRADAGRFAAEREAAVLTGAWIDPKAGKTPLRTWAEKVMASRLHLRPATRTRDVAYLANHVLVPFGECPIGHISKEEVQAWIQFLAEGKGLAPRTVRECYRVLASMMREAVDSMLIAESPYRRISLPRIPTSEKRFLSAGEVSRLAGCIDPRYRAFVYAGSYLGLRWGELAGLKRANLDLGAERVRVVGSLERAGHGSATSRPRPLRRGAPCRCRVSWSTSCPITSRSSPTQSSSSRRPTAGVSITTAGEFASGTLAYSRPACGLSLLTGCGTPASPS
jgi:integrase